MGVEREDEDDEEDDDGWDIELSWDVMSIDLTDRREGRGKRVNEEMSGRHSLLGP